MWVICEIGFFNIVCQDGDEERGLLTVKARSRKDLEIFNDTTAQIEESNTADYRFRVKLPRGEVVETMRHLVFDINYPKTKPKLAENNPDRSAIYFEAWEVLEQIQHIDETA